MADDSLLSDHAPSPRLSSARLAQGRYSVLGFFPCCLSCPQGLFFSGRGKVLWTLPATT